MSPTDFLMLFLSLVLAFSLILTDGWSIHAIGPALLLVAGGAWQFWMQWLRHESWIQHRDTGFAPGTQHLAIAAVIGWFLGVGGAMMWVFAARLGR